MKQCQKSNSSAIIDEINSSKHKALAMLFFFKCIAFQSNISKVLSEIKAFLALANARAKAVKALIEILQ